mmetsp:Transcript_22691/g.30013  ORF Transcript_22691/g.30013 Transcript_22691/m.30013 type:complete len:104 (-) Transcript_22691:41-352(-)
MTTTTTLLLVGLLTVLLPAMTSTFGAVKSTIGASHLSGDNEIDGCIPTEVCMMSNIQRIYLPNDDDDDDTPSCWTPDRPITRYDIDIWCCQIDNWCESPFWRQ